MKKYHEKKTITTELAASMIDAAQAKAAQMGIQVNVAVVDEGGHLVCFQRMDHAPILSIDIAINKAYTAIAFGLPTHEWFPLIANVPPLREGIVHTPRLVIFGGGYPLKLKDEVIGGIGVSGGTVEEDIACCHAALALLNK